MSLGGPNPPLSVILSWPTPNYVDPVSQGLTLKVINIVSIVLGTCIVAARMYARFILTKAPGADDAFILLGLAFGIVFSAFTIVATENLGVGRHIWDVPPANGPAIRLNTFVLQWCYTFSLMFIKISILLLYKRLSVVFSKTFLWASWIGIAYNIVYVVSFGIILLVQCRPVDAYWLSYGRAWAAEHTYTCSSVERSALPTYAALSVLGDVYSTILPLILVSTLQLPIRRMIGLYTLFALGFVVAGAGIVRTWLVYETLNKTYDTSWKMSTTLFWVTFELYLALLCACAPALKPFFKKFFIEPMKQYGSQSDGGETGQDQIVTIGSKSFQFHIHSSNEHKQDWISTEIHEIDALPQSREKALAYIPTPPTSPRLNASRRPSPSYSEVSRAREATPTSFLTL